MSRFMTKAGMKVATEAAFYLNVKGSNPKLRWRGMAHGDEVVLWCYYGEDHENSMASYKIGEDHLKKEDGHKYLLEILNDALTILETHTPPRLLEAQRWGRVVHNRNVGGATE